MRNYPRLIDAKSTFEAIVDWLYNDMIIARKAPGFLIGLSGTDSLVAFLAAYRAFERAGKPDRVYGVHFAPTEDFLYDHPEAEAHLWFKDKVIPWVRETAKMARVEVNTSIDWRCDGLRWGAMADMSVVLNNNDIRAMRTPAEQFWIVGTRNLSEDMLSSYSNASMLASIQPLIHLFKSEILQVSEYLKLPQVTIAKSCEADCICGRLRLSAQHPKELDAILMSCYGWRLSEQYINENIDTDLKNQLTGFIKSQIEKGKFKRNIPYMPDQMIACMDALVQAFEDRTINLREFNHRKHLYIAWYYLKNLPLKQALERYVYYLRLLLDTSGQSFRFNMETTSSYFQRLNEAINFYGTCDFDELVEKAAAMLNSR